MTSSIEEEFWKNLSYRRKVSRRRESRDDQCFPYRTRLRQHRSAVEYSRNQPLATHTVTASHIVGRPTEEDLKDFDSCRHRAENDENSGRPQKKQEFPDQVRQSVDIVNSELLNFQNIHLEIFRAPIETSVSWWKRHHRPSHTSHHIADESKPNDSISASENPICPYCGYVLSLPSIFPKICIPPRTADRRIELLGRSLQGLNITSWFHRKRHISEVIPLSLEALSLERAQDTDLENERMQIMDTLATTRELLCYAMSAVSRLQPHNQFKAKLARECNRLKYKETNLVSHLWGIEHEIDNVNELENSHRHEVDDLARLSAVAFDGFFNQDSFSDPPPILSTGSLPAPIKSIHDFELYNKS
jgi:hypothetical protein